jgi:hypothetical protein
LNTTHSIMNAISYLGFHFSLNLRFDDSDTWDCCSHSQDWKIRKLEVKDSILYESV